MEEHELDLLEDLFDFIDIDGPNADQMHQLYGIFVNDMIKSPIFIDKKIVGYNKLKLIHLQSVIHRFFKRFSKC